MRILCIDVGLKITGYIICDIVDSKIKLIKEEEIKVFKKNTMQEKLNYIFETLQENIKNFKPKALVIEKLYSHYRHPITLGLLAQIIGIINLLAYKFSLKIFEYHSTHARKALLGRGNVRSFQVKKMVENITNKTFKSTHTADAFSLAVAFSNMQKIEKLYDFKN